MEYQMLVNGTWVSGGESMPVYNPANEEVVGTVPVASERDVQSALEGAAHAQRSWARRTGVERGAALRRWCELVLKNRERLARIVSQEQGKPLSEAFGEVDFGASWIAYYAEFDRRIEGDILPSDNPDEQIWVLSQPVGVVVGIIPWNYPSALTSRATVLCSSHTKRLHYRPWKWQNLLKRRASRLVFLALSQGPAKRWVKPW